MVGGRCGYEEAFLVARSESSYDARACDGAMADGNDILELCFEHGIEVLGGSDGDEGVRVCECGEDADSVGRFCQYCSRICGRGSRLNLVGPYSLEFSNDARTAMIAVAELLLMVDVLSNVAIILKLLLCDVQVVVDCVVAKVKAMTEVFELMVPHQLVLAWLESHLSPPPPAPPIMIHPLSSLLTELYPHCRCDSPVRGLILPILNTYMAPEHLHPSIHDVTQQRLSFSINTSSTISSRTTRPSSPRDERR